MDTASDQRGLSNVRTAGVPGRGTWQDRSAAWPRLGGRLRPTRGGQRRPHAHPRQRPRGADPHHRVAAAQLRARGDRAPRDYLRAWITTATMLIQATRHNDPTKHYQYRSLSEKLDGGQQRGEVPPRFEGCSPQRHRTTARADEKASGIGSTECWKHDCRRQESARDESSPGHARATRPGRDAGRSEPARPPNEPCPLFREVRFLGTESAHTMTGTPSCSLTDPSPLRCQGGIGGHELICGCLGTSTHSPAPPVAAWTKPASSPTRPAESCPCTRFSKTS
ncbi:hypothetical protein FHR38_000291 [Micromonospora polyrhachis]|uniref:Uncharacterized protein n=1 Tax=Micromonospora polyrhachis TaxID=1282883 RepID=A0A7W7SKN8_9ACTN|nr:hypothetical protein [Micromonospora polyrhachis]